MTSKYHPREMWRSWKQRRKDDKKVGVFRRRPIDQFYRVGLIDATIIPPEHQYVKINMGKVGEVKYRLDKNGYIMNPEDPTQPTRIVREWPYGGVLNGQLKTGLQIRFAPYPFSKMAIVFTGLRKEELKGINVVSAEGAEFKVDGLVTYVVKDPLAALTVPDKDANFKELTRKFGEEALSDKISDLPILETLRAKGTNFRYKEQPEELTQIGIRIKGLRITQYDLPDELNKAFETGVTITATAEARLKESELVKEASDNLLAAGQNIDKSRGARAIQMATIAVNSNGNVIYNEGDVRKAEAIENVGIKIADTLEEILS